MHAPAPTRFAALFAATTVLAAAGAVGCGKDESPAPPTTSGGGESIEVITEEQKGPRLRHFELDSIALASETGVDVMLPRGYEGSTARYPAIYLLHGAGADETFWDQVGLEELFRDVPAIVVMPEGDTSFYSDPLNDGEGGPPKWETYHVDELIPWVDENFRTVAGEQGRAVAGISMGGLGAMLYAARHPGTFGAAASWSGIVEVEPGPMAAVLVATGRDPGILGPIWGDYPAQRKNWEEHNPVALAPRLDGVELVVSTGNGRPPGGGPTDPVETQIRAMNLALHDRLDSLGIPHTFDEGPGVHDVPDWRAAMERTLPQIAEAIGATGRQPAPAG